ncbi:MAG: TlyA family RNA methyltransferase [Alphaproteobacteria bacterium]|nr:TlyA family RNA methyltransferase [Alphaproteobacteria bacterium]
MKRERLDQVLVLRGLVKSRSRARDLIRRGAVKIGGTTAAKPGMLVDGNADLSVDEDANAYVARSATKLVAGLQAFGFSANEVACLDVGASTGGFTQVLLEAGASLVYAVDVGRGQLDPEVANDRRVVSLEGCDIRALAAEQVPGDVGAIVIDVSFISLTQALPRALSFAAKGCWLIALVKPQFEVGREAVGKKGLVRDEADVGLALSRIEGLLVEEGWRVCGTMQSPLPGKVGNVEYLIGAQLDD